jgi:hypothetical protein
VGNNIKMVHTDIDCECIVSGTEMTYVRSEDNGAPERSVIVGTFLKSRVYINSSGILRIYDQCMS